MPPKLLPSGSQGNSWALIDLSNVNNLNPAIDSIPRFQGIQKLILSKAGGLDVGLEIMLEDSPVHLVMTPPSPSRTKGAQDAGLAHSGLARSSMVASMA